MILWFLFFNLSFEYLGRITEDGLPIFDIKELNVGNGGGNSQSKILNYDLH